MQAICPVRGHVFLARPHQKFGGIPALSYDCRSVQICKGVASQYSLWWLLQGKEGTKWARRDVQQYENSDLFGAYDRACRQIEFEG